MPLRSDKFALSGKVVLITGAGHGIGQAIALRFAGEGAQVALLDQDESCRAVAAHIKQSSGTALALDNIDIGKPAQVMQAVARVIEHFGRIDVLVNNAGIAGGNGDFLDISLERWQRIIDVNLTGMFACGQLVARHMRDAGIHGSIINIGSVNSVGAERDAAAYVTAKHGVLGLTRAMSVDLSAYGIRVNCIAPGPVRVERNADLFDGPLHERLAARVPLGRPGSPDEIAAAAAFLASDDASFINGAMLAVDGGTLAALNLD
jgi:NAD(P)-dependent dehydrogenase (short-subunit alcohol dehydrogenase family)